MNLTLYTLALDTAEDGTRGYVFRTEKEAWTQLVQSLNLTQDPTCIACLEHGEYDDLDAYLEDITESHSTWSIDSHALDLADLVAPPPRRFVLPEKKAANRRRRLQDVVAGESRVR